MTTEERTAMLELKAKAGPRAWASLTQYLMADSRNDWCNVFVAQRLDKEAPFASANEATFEEAVKALTCPQCGGLLWKTEPGCAGHCISCQPNKEEVADGRIS